MVQYCRHGGRDTLYRPSSSVCVRKVWCSVASKRHHLDEHAGQRFAGLLVGDPALHRPCGLEGVGERGRDGRGVPAAEVGGRGPTRGGIDRDLIDGKIRVAQGETGHGTTPVPRAR